MTASLAAFLLRMLATAGVVLAVTAAVDRLGPRIGGVIAGLPIVVGPGLAFLALEASPAFLAEAAAFALLSLTATQAFMLAYALAAARLGPALALGAAIAAWTAAALVLARAAPGPWWGFALFLAAALGSGAVMARRARPAVAAGTAGGRAALVLRAVLAGLLVGAITVAAPALGPKAAGLVLGYPVGMTVIALTVHQRLGAAAVIGTLGGAALGTISIAAFALAVALAAPAAGAGPALGLALAASLLVTAGLLVAGRVAARRAGGRPADDRGAKRSR